MLKKNYNKKGTNDEETPLVRILYHSEFTNSIINTQETTMNMCVKSNPSKNR